VLPRFGPQGRDDRLPRRDEDEAVSSPLDEQGRDRREGALAGDLATEVRDSKICTAEVKSKLIREVMEHEASHGVCTQTFIKKVRRQIRPRATP
jgi:hypothetical protein